MKHERDVRWACAVDAEDLNAGDCFVFTFDADVPYMMTDSLYLDAVNLVTGEIVPMCGDMEVIPVPSATVKWGLTAG